MAGKQVTVESVVIDQFEMVAEEQVVQRLLGSPGWEGGSRGGFFQDGVFQQREFRIFLDVEVARQNGRNIVLANMLGNMADLRRPHRALQAEMGHEQPELVVLDLGMGFAEKTGLTLTGERMVVDMNQGPARAGSIALIDPPRQNQGGKERLVRQVRAIGQ